MGNLFVIVETTKCCTLLDLLYPSWVEVDLEWWLALSLVEVEIVVYSLLCEVKLVLNLYPSL